MDAEHFRFYGKQRITLAQLKKEAADCGRPIVSYGQNDLVLDDLIAHVTQLLRILHVSQLFSESEFEIAPGLMERLQGKDEGAYAALINAGQALSLARHDLRRVEGDARALARALNDINNEIGEEPVVRVNCNNSEQLIREYK